jgi:hypothetical protein
MAQVDTLELWYWKVGAVLLDGADFSDSQQARLSGLIPLPLWNSSRAANRLLEGI